MAFSFLRWPWLTGIKLTIFRPPKLTWLYTSPLLYTPYSFIYIYYLSMYIYICTHYICMSLYVYVSVYPSIYTWLNMYIRYYTVRMKIFHENTIFHMDDVALPLRLYNSWPAPWRGTHRGTAAGALHSLAPWPGICFPQREKGASFLWENHREIQGNPAFFPRNGYLNGRIIYWTVQESSTPGHIR